MIAIIDYGAGNIKSVQNSLNRLGVDAILTNDTAVIRNADKIIFPGVGSAGPALAALKTRGIDKLIPTLKQPILGICLGMQLMCSYTEEDQTEGLGIFSESVKAFPPNEKVPHMGWNNCTSELNPLFKGISATNDFYFVHSYYAEQGENLLALTNYMFPFASALAKDNFYGVQFHPEKSGTVGERLIQNFLDL